MKTTKQSGFFDIFELLIPVTIFGAAQDHTIPEKACKVTIIED